MLVFTPAVGFSHKEAFISMSFNKQPCSNDYFFFIQKAIALFHWGIYWSVFFLVLAFWHKALQECPLDTIWYFLKCLYPFKYSY